MNLFRPEVSEAVGCGTLVWRMRKDLISESADYIPSWMLHEVAHAGAEHLDPGYVAGYDRKAQTDPGPDVQLLTAHGLDARSVVIDFGSGTGTFALAVAPYCARVIAVDPSDAMLDMLRDRAAAARISNIEPVLAGFLSYVHVGPLAGFAYSRNALHHLPDFWKAMALTRIAAALRPGGLLYLRDIVYSFGVDETPRAIEDWVRSGAASSDDGWTPAELAEHVRSEHSTFSWLLEPMLERAGFEIKDVSFNDSRVFAAYLSAKR